MASSQLPEHRRKLIHRVANLARKDDFTQEWVQHLSKAMNLPPAQVLLRMCDGSNAIFHMMEVSREYRMKQDLKEKIRAGINKMDDLLEGFNHA